MADTKKEIKKETIKEEEIVKVEETDTLPETTTENVAVVDEVEIVADEQPKEITDEEYADIISRTAVLDILQKASARASKCMGSSPSVPSREMRALIGGLITDITNLK